MIEKKFEVTYPNSAKDERDERGRDGEEVNDAVQLEHEHQLVAGCKESHEKVGHEEDIEDEIELQFEDWSEKQ